MVSAPDVFPRHDGGGRMGWELTRHPDCGRFHQLPGPHLFPRGRALVVKRNLDCSQVTWRHPGASVNTVTRRSLLKGGVYALAGQSCQLKVPGVLAASARDAGV